MIRSPQRVAAAVLAALLLFAAGCGRGHKMCAVCQRDECGNLAFTIHLKNGSEVETCCPKCGLRYLDQEHPTFASLSVRDFDTAGQLDARGAFYVEGSDVTPCTSMHPSSPPKDEQGCCVAPVYDRCLPSVLAFRSKDRAEAFGRMHGGIVKTFANLGGKRAAQQGASSGR